MKPMRADELSYSQMREHFIETADLLTKISHVPKLNPPINRNDTKQNRTFSPQFLALSQELMHHASSLRCSENFYHLLNGVSRGVIDWVLEQNKNYGLVQKWDKSVEIQTTLLSGAIEQACNIASNRLGIDVPMPDTSFVRLPPHIKTVPFLGQYKAYPSPLVQVYIDKSVAKGKPISVLGTAWHEFVHHIHHVVDQHNRNNHGQFIKELEPDATLWQLTYAFSAYISHELSAPAYTCQPVESIAIETTQRFEANLIARLDEQKTLRISNHPIPYFFARM